MYADIARVSELICSQDDDLGRPRSTRKFCKIQRETGIFRSTVRRMAKDDLKLKIFLPREVQQLSDSEAKNMVAGMHAHRLIKQRMMIKLNERGLVTRRYSPQRHLETLKMIVSI